MIPYAASMSHMVCYLLQALPLHGGSLLQVCCQKVAETASADGGRQRWLAILYDEVNWSFRA